MPPVADERGPGVGADRPAEPVEILSPDPTRTEINLVARALRQDWVLSPLQKKALLSRLYKVVFESKFDRNRIAAAKAIGLMMGLNLRQQALDVIREKTTRNESAFVLAQLVAEAEQIALEHTPAERPTEKPK